MSLDDPSAVRLSTPFRGCLPDYGEPWPTTNSQERPHLVLRDAMGTVRDVLAGWQVPDTMVQSALKSIDTLVYDDRLCLLEFNEIMSNIEARLPTALKHSLNALRNDVASDAASSDAASSDAASSSVFPVGALQTTIEQYTNTLPVRQAKTLQDELLNPLLELSNA